MLGDFTALMVFRCGGGINVFSLNNGITAGPGGDNNLYVQRGSGNGLDDGNNVAWNYAAAVMRFNHSTGLLDTYSQAYGGSLKATSATVTVASLATSPLQVSAYWGCVKRLMFFNSCFADADRNALMTWAWNN